MLRLDLNVIVWLKAAGDNVGASTQTINNMSPTQAGDRARDTWSESREPAAGWTVTCRHQAQIDETSP